MRAALIVIALVLVAGAVTFLLIGGESSDERGGGTPRPMKPTTTTEELVEVEQAEEVRSVDGGENAHAIDPVDLTLEGRFIDRTGAAAGGVVLTLKSGIQAPRAIGSANSDGTFEVDVTLIERPSELGLEPPWKLAQPAPLVATEWDEHRVLVVERIIQFEGTVLDEDGTEVDGVEVAYCAPGHLYAYPEPRICLAPPSTSGQHGKFRLAAVALPNLTLRASSTRYEQADVPASPDGGEIEIRLSFRDEHLTGRVRNAAGAPLQARVAMHLRQTDTHPDTGEFALDLTGFVPLDEPLVVAAQSYAPAVIEDVGARFVELGRRHPPLEIVLEGAGILAGKVVDAAGAPVPEATVAVLDPAPAGDSYAEEHASPRGQLTVTVEADGSFLFDGLQKRPYTIVAVHPEKLDRVEVEAEPDAEDVVVQFPLLESRRIVNGYFHYPDGSAAGGLSASAYVELPGRPFDNHVFYRKTSVAGDGTFLLDDLPMQDLRLGTSQSVHPRFYPLPKDATNVDHVLYRLCPVDLLWPVDTDAPDLAHAITSGGEELPIYRQRWGVFRDEPRLSFSAPDGSAGGFKAASFWVPENGSLLVLKRRGKELQRLPLSLAVGVTNTVRP